WLYADLVFPEKWGGFPLKGLTARCFIVGWMPFTLWIDGEEIFKEEHAWMATGPIADPLPLKIEPGRVDHFVMRLEPIHVALGSGLIHRIVPEPCLNVAVELDAAVAQLRYADFLARDAKEKKLVERAAAAVDLKALAKEDWNAVMASLEAME